jgi:hypothetical protein
MGTRDATAQGLSVTSATITAGSAKDHHDRPWEGHGPRACTCGAGMPCLACNPCGGIDEPPRDPPGFVAVAEMKEAATKAAPSLTGD